MSSTNPADNKTKLSKNVREMKFMQRGALRLEQEQQEAEEKQAVDDEHWVLDMSNNSQQRPKYVNEPSYAICCRLSFGRRSFKGFNPEIEKLCKTLDAEASSMAADPNQSDHETTVGDAEMAEAYGSLSGTIAKRFKKRRERRSEPETISSASEDDEPSSAKKLKKIKRKFLKPRD